MEVRTPDLNTKVIWAGGQEALGTKMTEMIGGDRKRNRMENTG